MNTEDVLITLKVKRNPTLKCSPFGIWHLVRILALVPVYMQRRMWRQEDVFLLNTRGRYASFLLLNTVLFTVDILHHIITNWSKAINQHY